MDDSDKLARLDQIVLDEILQCSDGDALSNVAAQDIEQLSSLFVEAKRAHGTARMARAKAASRGIGTRLHSPMIGQGARASVVARPTVVPATLAARGARAHHGADQAGIDEDLAELTNEDDGSEA